MNKPTQATVADLRSALSDLEYLVEHHLREGVSGRPTALAAGDKVRRALSQLTQNDDLPCDWPGCHVRKPTRRALSAHYAMNHGPRKP